MGWRGGGSETETKIETETETEIQGLTDRQTDRSRRIGRTDRWINR